MEIIIQNHQQSKGQFMILVSKSDICILIAENGKKLIIKKDDHRFTLLKDKSKEEIEKWYLENK